MNLLLVRTGTLYAPEYVERLAAGVRKHFRIDEVRLFTDRPWESPPDVRVTDISAFELHGWWGKMVLFDPALRGSGPSVFLDLDTIVLGDLAPFDRITRDFDFATCASFTRQFGNTTWPCAYGSCIMTFRDGWGEDIWSAFQRRRTELLPLRRQQLALEKLYPAAALLQPLLPERFFLNYRELPDHPDAAPDGASLLIFGGKSKPHNVKQTWAQRAWRTLS